VKLTPGFLVGFTPDFSLLGSAVDHRPAVLAQLEGNLVRFKSGNAISVVLVLILLNFFFVNNASGKIS
jgi:hypothetical protein